MSSVARRVASVGMAVVALTVAGVGGLLAYTFGGMGAIPDGKHIGDGVTVVKDGYVASFLVDAGPGQAALVDAGNSKDGGAILAALKAASLDPSAIKAIFLTHGHPDHTAAAHLFPAATVYALDAEVPLLAGKVASKGPVPSLFGAFPSGLAVMPVHDGQVVDVGTLAMRAYAVPGHTAGSAAWLGRGVLFIGDSADFLADGRLVGAKWIFSDDTAQNHVALVALDHRLHEDGAKIDVVAAAHSGLGTFAALDAFKP